MGAKLVFQLTLIAFGLWGLCSAASAKRLARVASFVINGSYVYKDSFSINFQNIQIGLPSFILDIIKSVFFLPSYLGQKEALSQHIVWPDRSYQNVSSHKLSGMDASSAVHLSMNKIIIKNLSSTTFDSASFFIHHERGDIGLLTPRKGEQSLCQPKEVTKTP